MRTTCCLRVVLRTVALPLCFYCTSLLTWFRHMHFRQFQGSAGAELRQPPRDSANSNLSPTGWRSSESLVSPCLKVNYRLLQSLLCSRLSAPPSALHCNALPLVIGALWHVWMRVVTGAVLVVCKQVCLCACVCVCGRLPFIRSCIIVPTVKCKMWCSHTSRRGGLLSLLISVWFSKEEVVYCTMSTLKNYFSFASVTWSN